MKISLPTPAPVQKLIGIATFLLLFSQYQLSAQTAHNHHENTDMDEATRERYERYKEEDRLASTYANFDGFTKLISKVFQSANVDVLDRKPFSDMLYKKFMYDDRRIIINKIVKHELTKENIEAYMSLKAKEYASYYRSKYLKGEISLLPEGAKIIMPDETQGSGGNPTVQSPCTNVDFELANFTGWTGNYATFNCTVPTPNTRNFAGLNVGAINSGGSEHTIMQGGVDPVGGFSLNSPLGGTSVCRLSDNIDGCDAADLSQTFQVTAANSNFTYAFAVVMYDGHPAADAPKFVISMTDQSGAQIGCAAYTVDATQAAAQATAGQNNWFGAGGLYYKTWTTVFVPLTAYIGQNVTISFVSSDCNGGAHRGYAYIDCTCIPFQLIQSAPAICGSSSITISAPAGAATYTWATSGGGNIVSGGSSQTATINAAGSYSVTMTAFGSACSYTIDTIVPFSPGVPPVANFAATTPCIGAATNFTDQTTGGPTGWNWNFGDAGTSTAQSPSHTYAAAGTYTVTLTASNGCTDTYTTTATVNPAPVAAYTVPPVCEGTANSFTNTSTNATTYAWDFGDGATSTVTSPTHTYSGAGTYNAELVVTATGGCKDSITQVVTVNANPVPAFTSTVACESTATAFTNTTPANPLIAAWSWNFGDAGTSPVQTPGHTYGAAGTYTTTLTATTASIPGCTGTFTAQVIVNPNPVPNFTANAPCPGANTVYTNNTPALPAINTWSWDFTSDGAADNTTQSPSTVLPGAGTYTTTLTATTTNGCVGTYSTTVTVNPNPVPDFTYTAVCDGASLPYTNTTAAVPAIASWDWDFTTDGISDNSSQTPSNSFASAGTYTTTLTATTTFGCVGTYSATVVVNPNPVPSFTSLSVCQGTGTPFTNNTPAVPAIGNWDWDFTTDGVSDNTLQTPSNTFPVAGTYTTTLTATTTNGCVGTYTAAVVVNPNPVAGFTASTACEGTATVFNSSGSSIAAPDNIAFYNWTFGDGNSISGTNPSHTYLSCGTYTANLVVLSNNNCTNATNVTVTVNCIPIANFTAPTVCQGFPTVFTDASTVSNGTITGWCWDLDGNLGTCEMSSAGPSPVISPAAGTLPVSLTVSSNSGCINSITLPVTVNPKPIAAFSLANVCDGTAASFSNTTTGGAQTSSWDFTSDGSQDAAVSPVTNTYGGPNIYNVTLITTDPNGCKDTVTQALTVYPNPVANFSAPSVCFGFSTPLSDGSTVAAAPGANSINAWSWDFDGNGTADNATQNPGNIFPLVGNTSVSLTVTTNNNCTNSITLPIHVDPLPVVSFT
ncbi:MAG: PKD domain-containing protein, partial [Bacteroidia bacterium]